MHASTHSISGPLSSHLAASNFLFSKPFWQESFVQFPDKIALSAPPSVLLYGNDISLIETRGLILSAAGFKVYTATNAADADRIVLDMPLDVLLIGHSVPFLQANALLSMAHTLRPHLRCLVLVTGGPSPFATYTGATHRTTDGPGALVAKIQSLLNQRRDAQ